MPNIISPHSWTLEMRITETPGHQRYVSGLVWPGYVRVKIRSQPAESECGPRFRNGQCLMKDFQLEKDGSLDLRKVGRYWGFERASIFDHERENWFEPVDPFKLGPLAVEVLSEPTGFLTIVEYQNSAIMERKHHRQVVLDWSNLTSWWLARKGILFFACAWAFFYVKKSESLSWMTLFTSLVMCCLFAMMSHLCLPKPIIKSEYWIEKVEKYDYLL